MDAMTVSDGLEAKASAETGRALFRSMLLARARGPILEIGCGEGDLLRYLGAAGIVARGVEPDVRAAATARAAGCAVSVCAAEALPFADHSFEWVVSEYALHHFSHRAKALSEAARVARTGIAILDQWYDPAIPSQRLARRFEQWRKRIDRRGGMVHWTSLRTGGALNLLDGACPGFNVDIVTVSGSATLPSSRVEEIAAAALPDGDDQAIEEWSAIQRAMTETGLGIDGALIVFASRHLPERSG